MTPRTTERTVQEHFDARWLAVDRGFPEQCHIWQGAQRNGYGQFLSGYAHRFAWQQAHPDQPLPKGRGVVIAHLCQREGDLDYRLCVNAQHLERMTKSENLHTSPAHFLNRPEKAPRYRKDPERCRAGRHPWVPENLVYWGGNNATCRPCHNERSRERYRRRHPRGRVTR